MAIRFHGVVVTAVTCLMVVFAPLSGCQPANRLTPVPVENDGQVVEPGVGPPPAEKGVQVPTASIKTATFTGGAQIMPVDDDGDGLVDFLRVDVAVDAIQAGRAGILASLLTDDDQLIAIGTLDTDPYRSAPVTSADLQVGEQWLSLYFNGDDMRRAGQEGPGVISLGLFDEAGKLMSELTVDVPPLNPQDFSRSAAIEVQNITDSVADADTSPGHNWLRITAVVESLAAGEVIWQGQLFAGEDLLADVTHVFPLSKGTNVLTLDFPGTAIAARGLNGPYTVFLAFSQDAYTQSLEHTTAAYQASAFQRENKEN